MVEVTLMCVIIREGGVDVFPVDTDDKKSVGHLKKAIKAEMPKGIECDAVHLQLFLGKKDKGRGPWQTEAEVQGGLADTSDLEELDVAGAPLNMDGLSEEDVRFPVTKELVKAKKTPVHVFVVVPESSAKEATAASTLVTIDQMKMAMNQVFEDRDKKRSVYSMSDLHTEQQDKMAKKMRLVDDYITFDEPTPLPNACIPPYTWLEIPKSADSQRTNYMTYLETHLKRVLAEKRLSWLDVNKDKTMLSIADPRLPFAMKGTADMLLVDRRSTQHDEPLAGVRMVVELKKKVEQYHKPQAFGELVAASLKAPANCTPIGLLTDLNDKWHFLWFNEKKVLTRVSIMHPKNAFDFIAAAVAEPSSSKPFSVPFISRPLTKFKIDDFLPMPDDGADEMIERYELMADVVEPEFLMARRMEYAQQLVQSMPMYAHMYT